MRANHQIYKLVSGKRSATQQDAIDRMLKMRQGRSEWEQLKRELKQPRVREVAGFLSYIGMLRTQAEGPPAIDDIAHSFIGSVHNVARERLKQYQPEHTAEGEALIAPFWEMVGDRGDARQTGI